MTKELREQMDALRQIGPKLNKASEDAAKIIAELDGFLGGLNLGITGEGDEFKCRSYLEDEDSNHTNSRDLRRRISSALAYGRTSASGGFCIHIIHRTSAPEIDDRSGIESFEEVDVESEQWSSASRGDRLKSFATLPSLLDSIFTNARRYAEDAEKATATIRETMAALGIESPPEKPLVPPTTAPVRKPRT